MRLLLHKEIRELAASRAYWLLLMMIGPLVGHAFITAVNTYAEVSAGALAEGLSPLDGILVPTFGTYDIAATLLFPFVAIRLISAEKESGALKLMLQTPFGMGRTLAAKGIALAAGWLVAWIPGLAALGLWKVYGGSLYAPEVVNLLLGHLLRVGLSAGVAIAAAAIAINASSAAIATLGFTVGTWALEFVAEGRGGWLHTLAQLTPTAALRVFEQGELRASTVAAMAILTVAGFAVAAVWIPERRKTGTRLAMAMGVIAGAAALVGGASTIRASVDVSENRRHSFSEAEEAALRKIGRPLRVTVYLAPEDPRLMDLDRNVLSKLARILPVEVTYAAETRSGLFERDHYGEIWWQIGGRKTMSRSTTEAIVLETLYQLAQVPAAPAGAESYAGHPLNARPAGAATFYYLLWPLGIALAAMLQFRS